MAHPDCVRRPATASGFVPVLLANLLPLVGVRALDRDARTLVAVYALEVHHRY